METITLRVPENQKADLATEADERDMSLSEYTRKILDHRDPAVIDTDLTSVDDEVAAIYERLDELEAQVSDLRGGRSPPTDEAELLDDTNDEVLDAQNEHRDRQLDTDDEPDTSEWPLLNSLLPGVEITEADGGKHDAVETALSQLLAAGTATKDDLKAVYSDHSAGYGTAESLHNALLRPYLKRVEETGAVTHRNGKWRVDDDVTLADPTRPETPA